MVLTATIRDNEAEGIEAIFYTYTHGLTQLVRMLVIGIQVATVCEYKSRTKIPSERKEQGMSKSSDKRVTRSELYKQEKQQQMNVRLR